MKKVTVLVTGADGFIGSQFVEMCHNCIYLKKLFCGIKRCQLIIS